MKISLTFWMMTAGTKQRQSKKAATPEKAEISGLVLTQLACLWESSLVELSAFVLGMKLDTQTTFAAKTSNPVPPPIPHTLPPTLYWNYVLCYK